MADQPNLNQTRKDIMDIAAMTEETFRSVAANIQDMFANALDASDTVVQSFQKDISNSIKNVARESSKLADNFEKMNRGALKQSDIQKQLEARAAKIRSIEVSIESLRRRGTAESIEQANELNKQYQDLVSINGDYTEKLKEQIQILNKADKEIGLLGSGIKGLGSFLGKLEFDGLAKPLESAIENTRVYKIQLIQAQNEYSKLINKSEELTEEEQRRKEELESEIKILERKQGRLRNIASSLKEQLTLTNIMDFAAMELVKSFIQLDQIVGDTAKSLGISYSTASKLSLEFNSIANESGNIFVTTKGLNESFNQINQALGTNGQISKELLITQTELVKQAGYSVEAATMLSKLSLATGKPSKEIATQFLGQAKALNLVNKTAINEKQLLESISKVSKATLATFANQPGKLAEAAYEAKRLGLELDQLEGIQNSLLDIESSIASEFEAEVLTGKQLNLERARYYALTNDLAGLSKELAAQGITQDKFSKMNVIQQEAIAKAMGMSKDQMAGMLMEQTAISKLSSIDGKNAKEKYENAVKLYGVEKANAMLGNETLAQQMQSASIQDKFNASVEKLKEIFVGLVDPLLPVLNAFSSILNYISESKVALTLLQGVMAGLAVKSLINAVASIWSMALTPLGAALAVGATTALFAAVSAAKSSTMKDGIIDPKKGPIVSGEFGTVQLNPRDSIVAGTNLLGNNKKPEPIIITQPSQPVQQAPQIDYDKMALAMSKVKVQTNLDGVRVSSELQKAPMGIATRKI